MPRVSSPPRPFPKDLLFALRPGEWVKNLFIFAPLVFSQKLFVGQLFVRTLLTTIFFSLAASSVYLINDVLDIERDRLHPVKRLRPVASQRVTIKKALTASLILGTSSIVLSFALKPSLVALVVFYMGANLAYTLFLKHIVIVDILCISLFFLLRIAVGTVIAGIEFSYPMIFLTFLLALFLGLNKRRQEIICWETVSQEIRPVLKRYKGPFVEQAIKVLAVGLIIAYTFFVMDSQVMRAFGTNHLLYSIPFVGYGVFRYLCLVENGMHGDSPTAILFSDRLTQVNLALWVGICLGVIYFGM